MCRIIYNVAYKEIFPLHLSELRRDCKDFSVCNNENCPDRKKNKVKYIFSICLSIIKISCGHVDQSFVNYVFDNYERGRDYFNREVFFFFSLKEIVYSQLNQGSKQKKMVIFLLVKDTKRKKNGPCSR